MTNNLNAASLFFIIILISSFPLFSHTQDINNLDTKYGISKFKLGSSFKIYEKDVEFDMQDKRGIKYYTYKKTWDIQIFNEIPISQSIKIGFYKDKLFTVSMDFIHTNDSEFQSLKDNLSQLFGQPKQAPRNEIYDFRFFWKSPKTYLGLQKFSCKSEYNACKTTLYIISNDIDNQINMDAF